MTDQEKLNYDLVQASVNGHTETAKLLLKSGADVHTQDDEALRWASVNGHTETVNLLLDREADVHARNDEALRYASLMGHTEVVKLLLESGADVHAGHDTALRWASDNGHTEVVKLLEEAVILSAPPAPVAISPVAVATGRTFGSRGYKPASRDFGKASL